MVLLKRKLNRIPATWDQETFGNGMCMVPTKLQVPQFCVFFWRSVGCSSNLKKIFLDYRWIYFLTLVFGKWWFCWGSREAQFFETANHDPSCWGLVSDLINGVGNKGWKPMVTWLRKWPKTYQPSPDLPSKHQKESDSDLVTKNHLKLSFPRATTSPKLPTSPPQPPHQAVDATSFMRQSETIEATTPEISVARTAVASYFSEVKKSLQVGRVG